MSTTTSGPFTPVVRRMIPSGCVASGEFGGGVVQPFSQLVVAAPFVFGATGGIAGFVGETEARDPTLGDVDGALDTSDDPVDDTPRHAESDTTANAAATKTNRCTTDSEREGRIDRGYRPPGTTGAR